MYAAEKDVYVARHAENESHKRLPVFLCRVYRRDALSSANAAFASASCVALPWKVPPLQYATARALARSGEEMEKSKGAELRRSERSVVELADVLATSDEAWTPAGETVVAVDALATALQLYRRLYGRFAQTSGQLPVVAADMAREMN